MAQRASKTKRKRKPAGNRRGGRKPGDHGPGTFQPENHVAPRGPDVIPRKQVVATMQMNALFGEQLRDPRTGRLSQSKWAKPMYASGVRDFVKATRRSLYALAHGDAQEGATLAAGVVKLGDWFAATLDDKPSGAPRITIFNTAPGAPSREVPPDQGHLSPAEDGYVDVNEEDVP